MPNPVYLGELTLQQGSYGWTETWYTNKYGTSAAALDSLAQVRDVRFSEGTGVQTLLPQIKVSDVAVRGDSRVKHYAQGIGAGALVGGESSDAAYNAWLVRAEGSDVLRRQVWLRGMPDFWFNLTADDDDPELPPINPAMLTFLQHYLGVLRAGGWGVYGVAAIAATQIVQVVAAGRENVTNRLQFTIKAGSPMPAAGDTLRIYSVPLVGGSALPKIHSTQRVVAVVGQVVTVYQTYPVVPILSKPGSLRNVKKAVAVVRALEPIRPGSRITGVVRGVSKARRRRRV